MRKIKYRHQRNKEDVVVWHQKTDYDCSPVAILNALSWLGFAVHIERNYKSLMSRCNCKLGTEHIEITRALRSIKGLKVTRLRHVTKRRIVKFLSGNWSSHAVVISAIEKGKSVGHTTVLVKAGKRIAAINLIKNSLFHKVSPTLFRDLLAKRGLFPVVWFLSAV